MKSGAELIAEERARQVSQEGYGPEHDDAHVFGQMAAAAACYALSHTYYPVREATRFLGAFWPWGDEDWKPKSPVQDLVRAGALIAAEIDRRQRIKQEAEGPRIITP